MPLEPAQNDRLTACHGYIVLADDGWLGTVDTPPSASDSSEPDYLIVRTHLGGLVRRTLVPASLVSRVDVDDRLVYVWELARLPASPRHPTCAEEAEGDRRARPEHRRGAPGRSTAARPRSPQASSSNLDRPCDSGGTRWLEDAGDDT